MRNDTNDAVTTETITETPAEKKVRAPRATKAALATAAKGKAKGGKAKKVEDSEEGRRRSGLVGDGIPIRAFKNMRRVLRSQGVRLSDRPDIGEATVKAKAGKEGTTYTVTIDGTAYTWTDKTGTPKKV